MEHSTIAAIATAPGAGGIAVVRLSGPESYAVAAKVFHPANPAKRVEDAKGYTALFGHFMEGEEAFDEGVALFFRAPHSYTGEDVVEFAVHASPYIKGRLLELLCENGASMARRGEFSQRAFFNGKMDLVEAQGLCDLIASGNKHAHKLAMDSLDGKLSARLDDMKTKLSELLAQIEVRLDDVDEEMTPLADEFVSGQINAVLAHIKALADTFSVGKYIKDGLKTAIVGAPNSGKSSLLNALVGFDRAIVSSASGTTRDTVEETLEINGQKIILTDTAGIREHALDPAEKEGMKRSLRAMQGADLILFVLDSSRPLTPEEKDLWQDIRRQLIHGLPLVHGLFQPFFFRRVQRVFANRLLPPISTRRKRQTG